MNPLRRTLLRGTAVLLAVATEALRPLRAIASEWNQGAFLAQTLVEALIKAGVTEPQPTEDITLRAPEIAENGAQVPVQISSSIPGTQSILIFVDKNPQPFAGSFEFKNGAEAFISTRIKMGETSNLRIVAHAGDNYYMIAKEIKVTIGGCGP